MPRQPFAKARARSVARRACEPAETFSGGALATRGPSDIPGRQVLAGKLRRNALGLSCLDSEGLCAHATTIDHNFRALKSKSMVGYTGCSDAQGCRASASVPITRAWPPRRNRHVRAAASRSTSTPSSSSTHATGTSWFATGAVTCSNCSSEPKRMPKVGLEPTRGFPHRILSPARLPVPPLRLCRKRVRESRPGVADDERRTRG